MASPAAFVCILDSRAVGWVGPIVIALLTDPQILQMQTKNGPECRKGGEECGLRRRRSRMGSSRQR